MNRSLISAVLTLSTAFFAACDEPDVHDPVEQLNSEVAAIDSYLESNNMLAEKHISGIRIVIDSLGGGLPVSIYTDPEVEVGYKGTLFSNGATFAPQAVADDEPLSGYIPGWQIALSLLPEGSRAKIFIPSYYAYGTSNTNGIPPNSTLVFDLDFKKIVRPSSETSRFTTDTTAIRTYLTKEGIDATYDSLGIWYVITQAGTGATPGWYDQVHVKYTFKKFDGTTIASFEQEPNSNFDSRVVDYFNGIQIGLQRMNEGSKATFFVPSGRAFATQSIKDSSSEEIVAPNTNIIVEMELIEVIQ